jgi:hypothetical protein
MNQRLTLALALSGAVLALACSPDSGSPPADCGAGRVCDCMPGDPNCSPCQPGYRQALVGSECVPTCSAPQIDCGSHGTCEETAQGAECRCEAGYTGSSCASCENGLSLNADGQCLGELAPPALLTLSSQSEQVVLGALVPPSWKFLPLATVANGVTDVAYDSTSGTAYLLDEGRLFRLDLATGNAVGRSQAGTDLGSTLCVDAAGQRAFTASADAVYEIGLEDFEVTELAAFGAQTLEYDAERDALVGVDAMGATFELGGSTPVAVGQAPELEALAMAFDSSLGRAYFLGSEAETDDERLLRYCREALSRLGAVPAWQAQVVEEAPAAADPLTLEYDGADSALLAVNLAGADVDRVRIDVAHPDGAVCVVSEENATSELEVEVTAGARAGFVLLAAPHRGVALDLSAVSADFSTSVVVYSDEGLTISGPSAGVLEYEAQPWSNLGLTTLTELATLPAPRLVLMDWASQATLPLELTHRPVGSALAWVGETP